MASVVLERRPGQGGRGLLERQPESWEYSPGLEAQPPAPAVFLRVLRLADLAVGLLALLGFAALTGHPWLTAPAGTGPTASWTLEQLLLLTAFACLWYTSLERAHAYTARSDGRRAVELRRLARGALPVLAPACAVIAAGQGASLRLALLGCGATCLLAISSMAGARSFARAASAPPPATRRRVLVLGSGPRALRAVRSLPPDREVVGVLDAEGQHAVPELRARRLAGLELLDEVLMRMAVDEVLVALPVRSRHHEIQLALRTCECMGIEAQYLADVFDSRRARPRHDLASGRNVVSLQVGSRATSSVLKRALDIVGALVGLVLLAPLMLLVALGVKLSSPGPVLYVQARHGRNRRLFRMYKFRTMQHNADVLQPLLEARNEVHGPTFKLRDDPRVTRLGRVLRVTSLDELPQLWNVFLGDMSLVGPRPLPQRDVSRFTAMEAMRRFSVKPGITGLWQVQARAERDFRRWLDLDLRYIDEWSLWLDLRILLQTVPAVLSREGAV